MIDIDDLEIGKTFIVEGKEYKVKKVNGINKDRCDGCAFIRVRCSNIERPFCGSFYRADGNSVIFTEVRK